ncbi:MAG TPA: hypothetical protein VH092_31370 [Urbifossiella sp.]|nr:hypothetical protein [Urbifossiella sp.]
MDEQPLFSKKPDDLLPAESSPRNTSAGAARRRRTAPRQARVVGKRRGFTRWWQFGLAGSFVLSYATVIKFIRAVRGGDTPDADWGELPGFAAALFGMGFLCGVIVWAGRGLYQKIGMVGDAIVGLAVMVVFFISCMLVFEPGLLREKFATGGAPMLGLAAVAGPFAGVWIGRDLRKDSAPQ